MQPLQVIKRAPVVLLILLIVALSLTDAWRPATKSAARASVASAAAGLPRQTDVDRAEHLFDKDGVPYLNIASVGKVRHPAWVAIYALQYYGEETYSMAKAVTPDSSRAEACVRWLAENLKPNAAGDMVWWYEFDNTYNDLEMKAPWFSAFGQAVGVEALVWSAQHGGGKERLSLACKAAESLLRPISTGGLMFEKGDDTWFEEVATPADNPPHILNGHMRALLAIKKLSAATGEAKYQQAFEKGLATLKRWLPLYDTGYCLRYDLNPRKQELLLRFNNPYGYQLTPLAIDKISLFDPADKHEVTLDVGAAIDPSGSTRIAGNDWGQPESLDGRTVRRLAHVTPANMQQDIDGQIHGPGTFFYLNLPSQWRDNLRSQWLELVIEYKDEHPGNIAVQMRSICPGPAFRDLRDGDLLLSGSGKWRQWRIPVRVTDLGYWVGQSYGEKHAVYLEQLAKESTELKQWAAVARGYCKLAEPQAVKIVNVKHVELPRNTPVLPIFSFDKDGVVLQHIPTDQTVIKDGFFTPSSDAGASVYSPFIVASQLLRGKKMLLTNMDYRIDGSKIQKEPALRWLLKNYARVRDAIVYEYGFDNAYNDVFTAKPWQSAFGQAFVLKALMTVEGTSTYYRDVAQIMDKAARAYGVNVRERGLQWVDRFGGVFYEEVPNASHVLNGHLFSCSTLKSLAARRTSEITEGLAASGLESLRRRISDFDTGYWLRYDANPKKEILLQIDWVEADASPLISEIVLENPQTSTATRIDVGDKRDHELLPHLSGADWLDAVTVDGQSVRQFSNGYAIRSKPVAGGTVHNAFVVCALPEQSFSDCWDAPPHRLVIRYKDVSPGNFAVKVQSINHDNELTFVPLRSGQWTCVGDGKWKEATFILRPQDMGWYVGPDYQVIHIEQLSELARQSGDWLFSQYAERQQYFLQAQQSNRAVIVNDGSAGNLVDLAPEAEVTEASPTYPGFGVQNALDSNPDNNYVAMVEGPLPQSFTIHLPKETSLDHVVLIWESQDNYATDYKLEEVSGSEAAPSPKPPRLLAEVKSQKGKVQVVRLGEKAARVANLRLTVHKTAGQPRILLRQIRVMTIKDFNK